MILAEHHTLYEYNLVGAKNHYIGLAQTETVRQSNFAFDYPHAHCNPALLPAVTTSSYALRYQQYIL